MLLCKKIKIEVSDQGAAALEFMQEKSRGLCNWWVMKLRNGERWNLEKAKQSLRESKAYDPELRYVYGKLLKKSMRPNKSGTSGVSATAWYKMIGDSTALCRCSPTSVCALGKSYISSVNAIRRSCATSANTSRTCPCGNGRIAASRGTVAW